MSDWDWDDDAFGEAEAIPAYQRRGAQVEQQPTMLEHRISPGRYVTITPEMRRQVASGGEPLGGGKFTHRVVPGRYLVTDGPGMGYNGVVVGGGGASPGYVLPGSVSPGASTATTGGGSWGFDVAALVTGLANAGATVAQSVAQVEAQRAESSRLTEQARGEMSMLQQMLSQQAAQPQTAAAPVVATADTGATTALLLVGGLVVLLLGGGLIWALSRSGKE